MTRLRAVLAGLLALVVCVAPLLLVPAAMAGSSDGYSHTKDVTRDFFVNGQPKTDLRQVTVTVNKTTQLQDRERIQVSWSGAHPSGGRAVNPYGENGLNQEYPVVIMECRGVDNPHAPAAKQISPSTCWTSTWQQRSVQSNDVAAIWRHDKYATSADTGSLSGVTTLPKNCAPLQAGNSEHLTEFKAADGTTYAGCNSATMPPEAAVGASDPPNEVDAFTGLDGTGSVQFEVRGVAENQSLGCSHTVACSLVVIPIMGLSCADQDTRCNNQGRFAAGSSNFAQDGVEPTVSPQYWWSASNWRNRFSIPLSFGLPPSTCDLLGSGTPVNFFGSELLSQAALQWAPAYCLNKQRFNWHSNTMPDDAAFTQMTAGAAPAAEVSGPQSGGGNKIGYAPTAVSGFGIAYDIDKPDNAGVFHGLRLNARLLAKLLTESYPGSNLAAQRPGLGNNPLSLNLDPEFQKLNPGLDTTHASEAAAALLTLSTGSDVTKTMTEYIAHDPEAMAFIDGKPDPWGMTVNPAYKNLSLPVSTWPLLDNWVPPKTGKNPCLDNNPAPYLPKISAPVISLRLIATAMLLSWPNVQTVCTTDTNTNLYKLGRIDPQGIGNRFMLGVVTLADAQRYGLDVASLQAKPGSYVAPDNAGLSSALKLSTQTGGKLGPFVLSQAGVRASKSAYPGTMVVYTAAKTQGLDKADAAHVAQFIRISSTEGQRPGRGNGQLPAGYLPIRDSGVTKPLYASAQRVAAAVAAQKVPQAHHPKGPGHPAGSTSGGTGGVPTTGSSLPSAGSAPLPTSVGVGTAKIPAAGHPRAVAQPKVTIAATTPTAKTTGVAGGFGSSILPLLLLVGLGGGVMSVVTRLKLRQGGAR